MTQPGDIALVTGGSRGIGRACVEELVQRGYRVAFTWNTDEVGATDTVDEVQQYGDVVAFQCSVDDESAVSKCIRTVERTVGPIAVVINNAGVTSDDLTAMMSTSTWDQVVDVNLRGAFFVTRAALGPMVRRRYGRLLYMSSVAAFAGAAGQANYAASKAGLIGFCRAVAREYAPRGITANVVAPGPIDTELLAAAGADRVGQLQSLIPIGRLGVPREVAYITAMLCDRRAAFINGAVIPVDGGMAMGF